MNHVAKVAVCVMFSVSAAIAQTDVKTTNGGTAGSVPVFTSSTNVENSVIAQANGNVGIGTTTPTQALDVRGTIISGGQSNSSFTDITAYSNINAISANPLASIFAFGSTSTVNYEGQKAGTAGLYTAWGDMVLNVDTSNAFRLFMNSTEALHVTNTGNVGIGTTSPTQPLEVNGNTKVDGTLTVNGTGGLNVASGGVTFPDGTVQTTAYPASSSGGSTPIQVVNNATENENEAEINGGVSANGSGLKHISTNASCQMYQYDWNFCKVSITWPGTPFANTNYDVVCTPKTGAYGDSSSTPQGVFLYVADADKTTTSVNVTVQIGATTNKGGLITVAPGISCIAIHD